MLLDSGRHLKMGYILSDKGEHITRRGGADDQSDDDMLLLEIVKRAPALSQDDLQRCFIAIRMEYGTDALDAIRSGHVRFEERPAGQSFETTQCQE